MSITFIALIAVSVVLVVATVIAVVNANQNDGS
jgi:hypothetical protein